MLPVKQSGVADGPHENTTALVGNLSTELLAVVAFDTEKSQFDQLMGA